MSGKVFIKAKKARPFFGRHPWVFASAIDRVEGSPQPGDAVEVFSHDREFIAHGLFNPHSTIRVRLYSWDQARPIDDAMIAERIARAIDLRQGALGLGDPHGACRLVFSESDGLSGLIVDRYANLLVVQFTSLAMAQHEKAIVATLEERLSPAGIYRRTERGVGELEKLEIDDTLLAGAVPEAPIEIQEGPDDARLGFLVDVRAGQKTGAFLDQRDNRRAAARYAAGRDVLDLFCFGGGFALAAMKWGKAKSALGLDVSAPAITLAQRNAERNDLPVEFLKEDVTAGLARLKAEGRSFGLIVCDPPKFARTPGAVDNALRGYENLNRAALEILEPGGILVTCSCSGHVDFDQFTEAVVAAAQRLGRDLQFLEVRTQAPDHPVSAFCLETQYLKCLIAHAP